jgi:hypothetical protein
VFIPRLNIEFDAGSGGAIAYYHRAEMYWMRCGGVVYTEKRCFGHTNYIVAVSLPKLTADTNMLCYVQALLEGRVLVHMGEDEKMFHCLYFSSIL